jgi:hypothetical protein
MEPEPLKRELTGQVEHLTPAVVGKADDPGGKGEGE